MSTKVGLPLVGSWDEFCLSPTVQWYKSLSWKCLLRLSPTLSWIQTYCTSVVEEDLFLMARKPAQNAATCFHNNRPNGLCKIKRYNFANHFLIDIAHRTQLDNRSHLEGLVRSEVSGLYIPASGYNSIGSLSSLNINAPCFGDLKFWLRKTPCVAVPPIVLFPTLQF